MAPTLGQPGKASDGTAARAAATHDEMRNRDASCAMDG